MYLIIGFGEKMAELAISKGTARRFKNARIISISNPKASTKHFRVRNMILQRQGLRAEPKPCYLKLRTKSDTYTRITWRKRQTYKGLDEHTLPLPDKYGLLIIKMTNPPAKFAATLDVTYDLHDSNRAFDYRFTRGVEL